MDDVKWDDIQWEQWQCGDIRRLKLAVGFLYEVSNAKQRFRGHVHVEKKHMDDQLEYAAQPED